MKHMTVVAILAFLLSAAIAPTPSAMPVVVRPVSIADTRIISMSPDGRLLAAARPATAYLRGELCTYDIATLTQRACADLSGLAAGIDIGSVRWSPDSTKLVFAENVFRIFVDGDLWLVDAATGSLVNLDDDHADGRLLTTGAGQTPSADFTLPTDPTFGPDGTSVTYSRSYVRGGAQAGNDIARVPTGGGEPTRLLAVTAEQIGVISGGMAWSQDGRALYFTRIHPVRDDPSAGIWVVDGEGGGLRQVLGPSDAARGAPSLLQVSPRGDAVLAFYRNVAVTPGNGPAYALVDPTTGTATPLLVSGETRPELAAVAWAGFSPDGSWLVETTMLDHQVLLRDVKDGREVVLVPEGLQNAAPIEYGLAPTWASDGTILLTGGGAFDTATLLTVAQPGVSPTPVVSPSAQSDTGEVSLLPVSDLSGDREFTLGGRATVEYVSTLEVRQATRGWNAAPVPPSEGSANWTFLVRFERPDASPGPFGLGSGHYNVLGFHLRDDQGFEYPVLTDGAFARQPTLLYGELAAGQRAQGWLTFQAPANAPYVELVYAPIADEPVLFRMAAP